MIDATTKERLVVRNHGTAGPYLRLPVSLLDHVRQILDQHGISHDLDIHFISMNGGPERALINFGRKADPEPIQAILDRND